MSITPLHPEQHDVNMRALRAADDRLSEATTALARAQETRRDIALQAIYTLYGLRVGSVVRVTNDKTYKVASISVDHWNTDKGKPSMKGYVKLKSGEFGTRLCHIWAWSDDGIKLVSE